MFIYLTFKGVRARARTNSEILMCCNHQKSHWSQCCKDAICGSKNYTHQFLHTWDALLSAAILVCVSSTEHMLFVSLLTFFFYFSPPIKEHIWDIQFALFPNQAFSGFLKKVVQVILKNSFIRYTVLPYVCCNILECMWIVTVTQVLTVTLLCQGPGKGEISPRMCATMPSVSLPSLPADNWWTS